MSFIDELLGRKPAFGPRVREISMKDRERLFFLMGMMFKSGMTSVQALRTVAVAFKNEKKEDLSQALLGMAQKVAQGKSIGKAAESEPVLFTDVHRAAVLAGESANRMQQAFEILRMLEHKKLMNARGGMGELLTPTLLLLMSIASFFNTGINTLPKMAELAVRQGKELALLPKVMLLITGFVATYWYVFAAVIIISIVTAYGFLQSAGGRFTYDKFLMQAPLIGRFIQYKTYAQMLLYFPHLLESGVRPKQMVPIMEALSSNLAIKRKIDTFNQTINTGGKLSQAMERAGFPHVATTPVSVAENYVNKEGNTNDVLIEGMHHSYEIMERELEETHKRFLGFSTSFIWMLGGLFMLVEMMSVVLTQI